MVLQLAKGYEVSLDEPVGTAPSPAAEPRSTAPHSFGDDKLDGTLLPIDR
ncbi:transcriptional regulator, partial [Streptomyces sp. ZL-24]